MCVCVCVCVGVYLQLSQEKGTCRHFNGPALTGNSLSRIASERGFSRDWLSCSIFRNFSPLKERLKNVVILMKLNSSFTLTVEEKATYDRLVETRPASVLVVSFIVYTSKQVCCVIHTIYIILVCSISLSLSLYFSLSLSLSVYIYIYIVG